MEVISANYRVSSWNNVSELRQVYEMIFGANSTTEDMNRAYLILQSWKVRRSQETLTGILCTLSLLDAHLKDVTGKITDSFTLCTIYSNTLTKFINYATSYQIQNSSMYRSAKNLGIDSFLIDLRHMCAHGKQVPSLEVFRKSQKYCLNWIKKFFWEAELNNVTDATSIDIRYDAELAVKLNDLLPLYDAIAELLHKNINIFDKLTLCETSQPRWPMIEAFMKKRKSRNFRHSFTFLTTLLIRVINSKAMAANPQTFFHEMFERCDFFMNASETQDVSTSDEDHSDVEITPVKPKKREPTSVVNIFQHLLWQIAKQDYLKLFLDMLYQLSLNENEDSIRRASARFWISTILSSFKYYQKYCKFSKEDAIMQKQITDDARKIYSYQLDADLKKVLIFAGTQVLPSSLKYSREFFTQLLDTVDADNQDICINLLPFVFPPLSEEQLSKISDLISIKTSGTRKSLKDDEDKVYTINDLLTGEQKKPEDEENNLIWHQSTDNIDWSAQPIGMNFSLQS